jgi:hypothetical protein
MSAVTALPRARELRVLRAFRQDPIGAVVRRTFGSSERPMVDDAERATASGVHLERQQTAHPYKWSYDADADHARYLECNPRQQNLAQAA